MRVYVKNNAKFKLSFPDGKSAEIELQEGRALCFTQFEVESMLGEMSCFIDEIKRILEK